MKTAEIKINDNIKNEISPLIFGSFTEHIENCIAGGIFEKDSPLSDSKGIRQDVLEKCRELAPTALRFPGGTVIGIYHWEEHVGKVENRRKKKNIVWGGMMTHEFGTCEFIEYCRNIGAEPLLCVNMPTGTAEEAANWVEYCNGNGDTYYANLRRSHGYEEPFNVKYWCIGNESYAVPDLGTQHDVNTYIRDAWEFTKYMKMTDPSIKLIYVGFDEKWNRAVLDSLGDVCDYLSLHFYAGGKDTLEQTKEFERNTLSSTINLINEYNSKGTHLEKWYRIPPRQDNIRIAIDEWNIWNPQPDLYSKYGLHQIYTWKDALWTADFPNMMIRNSENIGIANLAQMVNVIAPIMADKNDSWKQCTFYPLKYYREYCRKFCVPSEVVCSGDSSSVSCVITEDDRGKTAFVVNFGEDNVTVNFPFAVNRIISLSAESPDAVNSAINDCVIVEKNIIDSDSIILKGYSINLLF